MLGSATYGLRVERAFRSPAVSAHVVLSLIGMLLAPAYAQDAWPTNVNMTVTNNVVIEWVWETQFMFSATSAGNGAVGGDGSGWYDQGAALHVSAAPAVYYHFAMWTGTVTSVSNPLPLTMAQPHSLVALFGPDLATNYTPVWWLAEYGWTNNFDAAETNDADLDGLLNWQEWIAGTDPTNDLSVLSVTNLFQQVSWFVLCWPSVSNRIYGVDRATNLILPGFEAIATNLPATPPVNVHTDQVPGIDKAFYRIKVEKP